MGTIIAGEEVILRVPMSWKCHDEKARKRRKKEGKEEFGDIFGGRLRKVKRIREEVLSRGGRLTGVWEIR